MDFMRLLLKINYYVAMSPKYDWENRRVIKVWWHAYLCIVLSTASIIVSIVCNYLSPLNWRFNVRWPEIFMQIAYLFLQAVFAAINAISPVLHFSEWGKMVNKLQVVDDILQIRKTRMDRFEPWIFVVYIIFIAEFKTFAVVLYIKFVSWEGYKHLVVFSFINLYYSHALFFMIHFNRVIRTALMTINKKLLVLSPCNKNTSKIYLVGIGTHRTETSVIINVKDLKEAYKALNDVVICYNKIFGSRLFLTLTFAFMYMLDQMALAVLIPRLGTPTFNKHFGLDLRIKNVISLILTVVSSHFENSTLTQKFSKFS